MGPARHRQRARAVSGITERQLFAGYGVVVCSRCSKSAVQVVAGQLRSGKRIEDNRCRQHQMTSECVGMLLIYQPTGSRYRVLGTSEIPVQSELAY